MPEGKCLSKHPVFLEVNYIEIGVGTGRFAAPLGIKVGVDPSMTMLTYAAKRGVLGLQGTAEALP